MKRKKIPKPDDFAPLPKKAIRVDEAEFDKVIAKHLRDSKVGIYEIKPQRVSKRSGRQP